MNKVALITGGTRGIGLGIARALADEGIDLALCGRRAEADVAPTLDELRGRGIRVLYVPTDIGGTSDREALIESIRGEYGRLNVLVNNAGVAPLERKDILEATEESFDRVLGINLRGVHFLTRDVCRWMVDQRHGDDDFTASVVTVTSVSSTLASPNRAEYCISKAGLSMDVQLWAVRMAEFGIPVYEVRPGVIKTDMTAGVQDKYDRMIEEGLLLQARWGMPDDVGRAVAMLVRGDLGYSTGQVIMVDGGMTLGRL